jgi:ubiquinone/menaquinone biosynthesis C-methylase UbiE
LTSERLTRFYNEEYPEIEFKRSFEDILLRRAEYTSDIIGKLHDGTILDVGGSDGKVAEFIESRTGLKIVISDISKTLLARPKIGYKVIADAQILPFKSNSFDAVYSLQVLEHIPEYDAALDEIIRVSKSLVILSTDVCTTKTSQFQPELNADGHCQVFGFAELKKLLMEKNLTILNICFPAISKKIWKLMRDEKVINWVESMKIAQWLIYLVPRFRKDGLEALFVCEKR